MFVSRCDEDLAGGESGLGHLDANIYIDYHRYMTSLPDQLKLLGDPTRYKILEFLAEPVQACCSRDDGVCGCDLEAYLDLSQPTVSHHMKQLVEAGLVSAERRGRWVYYALAPGALRELSAGLERLAVAAELGAAATATATATAAA